MCKARPYPLGLQSGDTKMIMIVDELNDFGLDITGMVFSLPKGGLIMPSSVTVTGSFEVYFEDPQIYTDTFYESPEVFVKNPTQFCKKCGQHHKDNYCNGRGKRR